MNLKVLSSTEVEQFMELGYVKVEQAYDRKQALRAQDFLWGKLEEYQVERERKETWKEPMVRIRETYDHDVFQACSTTRFADAIEDLVGRGRVKERVVHGENPRKTNWGWWPVNFSLGAEKSWNVPIEGWHWDGIQFRHYVDSSDQGLLCLCLFSDIGPRGGGTLVAEGSFRPVARFLREEREGIELREAIPKFKQGQSWFRKLTGAEPLEDPNRIRFFMEEGIADEAGGQLKIAETTGEAGDVFLCHPFLIHAASQNHSGIPRFMCNRTSPLKERLNFRRADRSAYSPLELSIKRAIE